MKLRVDKTGFPLVELAGVGMLHLWPVTKLQFEGFLSEPGGFGDNWYESVCKYNPRLSYRKLEAGNYEGLFLTGVLPEEALAFARWLGEDFDLPTVAEWRRAYGTLDELPDKPAGLSKEASWIWDRLSGIARTPAGFALMEEGVLEWVRNNGGFAGLGTPRPAFLPNAWNPLGDMVRITAPSERVFYIGFRLIKRQ